MLKASLQTLVAFRMGSEQSKLCPCHLYVGPKVYQLADPDEHASGRGIGGSNNVRCQLLQPKSRNNVFLGQSAMHLLCD